VGAAVAINPDEMYKDNINPDVSGFVGAVSKTPTLIFTGSKDDVEATGSAWLDFQMLAVKTKAFVDLTDNTHNDPEHNDAVAYAALWAQAFALKNSTAENLIYGDEAAAMRNVLSWSKPGERNTGYGEIGLLLCKDAGDSYPPEYVGECSGEARMCGLKDGSTCCGCSVGKDFSIGGDGCSSSPSNWMECKGASDIQPGTCQACGKEGQIPCETHTPANIGSDGCYNDPPHEIGSDGICHACGRDGQKPCSKSFGEIGGDGCSSRPTAEERNGICIECGLLDQPCCHASMNSVGSDGCQTSPETYYCHPKKRDGTCSNHK